MAVAWRATDLSVDPPSRAMADTDIETFGFDAGEPIEDATGTLTRLDTMESVDELIVNTDIVDEIAALTISGLTRGIVYELAVTFQNPTGRRWTRTLVIPCVA
jgi:hypothetical protein